MSFFAPDPPEPPTPPAPTQTYEPTPEELAAQRSAIEQRRLSRSRLAIPTTPQGNQQSGAGLRIQ